MLALRRELQRMGALALLKPPLISRKWVETFKPGLWSMQTVSTREREALKEERARREQH